MAPSEDVDRAEATPFAFSLVRYTVPVFIAYAEPDVISTSA